MLGAVGSGRSSRARLATAYRTGGTSTKSAAALKAGARAAETDGVAIIL